MSDLASGHMDGILYDKCTVFCFDHTAVAGLTAHGPVERRFGYDHRTHLSFREAVSQFGSTLFGGYGKRQDRILTHQLVIAVELGGHGCIQLFIYGCIRAHVVGHFTCGTGLDSLLFHTCGEAVLIHGDAFLRKDLSGKIQRESVGIIELEGLLTGQHFLSGSGHFLLIVSQDPETLIDGLVEILFLLTEYGKDMRFLLLQFGISIFGILDHGCCHIMQECSLDAQKPAVTCRPPEQTTHDISPAFIGGHDPVGSHEGNGTDMVRDHTDGYIGFILGTVSHAGQFADLIPDGLDGIHIKDGVHILNHNSQTLQSHTGIDILLL